MATEWRFTENQKHCLYLHSCCWVENHRKRIAFIASVCLCGSLFCFLAYLMTTEVLKGQEDTIDAVRITALRERVKSVEDAGERQWITIGTLQTDMAAVKADMASMKDSQSMNTHLLYAIIGALAIKIALELLGRKTPKEDEERE